ncbi:MAG: DUF3160 domain-containing protein [Magnetococcales bacterium]|nr:DUF3160 domain-containing protein [Magnetococcales bacterium]
MNTSWRFLLLILLLMSVSVQATEQTPEEHEAYYRELNKVYRSLFEEIEPVVAPSPSLSLRQALPNGVNVVDIKISPTAPEAMVLLEDAKGVSTLFRWRMGAASESWTPLPPPPVRLNSLTWHRHGERLFAAGEKSLLALNPDGTWHALWQSPLPISRLIAGPRPFWQTHPHVEPPFFRLFFALQQEGGNHVVASVTEEGKRFYHLTSPGPVTPEAWQKDMEPPAVESVPNALPIEFHPAGHRLILSGDKGCFLSRMYSVSNWDQAKPLDEPCGGEVSHTPNGTALLHWQPGKPGVEVVEKVSGKRWTLLPDQLFRAMPRLTTDGKGLLGWVAEKEGSFLLYQPVPLPLADVVNAWMFLESPQDQSLFSENGGLYRPLKYEQLYSLYESELYGCGHSYASYHPARPFLVTTDIFWEVFAAAYQGIFLTLERQRAMPAFRDLVQRASQELREKAPNSRLAGVFTAANALMSGQEESNPEATLIKAAKGEHHSPVLKEYIDYSLFAPRGHYSHDGESRAYFQAMRYLGHLKSKQKGNHFLEEEEVALLRSLSPTVQTLAATWIQGYQSLIAPSRAPLAWNLPSSPADYASRTVSGRALFPLSWGWDNEVLDRVVHHEDDPMSRGGWDHRWLPTGLDLAMAFGNGLSEELLENSGLFVTYPMLRPRLKSLQERFAAGKGKEGENLYARWLRALAEQWAEEPATPIRGPLWRSKRLQTGLASWATLRHATILVNEISGAECGEAGFEEIIMRPPRGYVEPDPATFNAIADLFETTARMVARSWPSQDPLAQGIIRRLEESRKDLLHFGAMAQKELRGEPLTGQEYDDIHHVAAKAEHNFLVFFSLMAKENALIAPDPIMKVAEVAGTEFNSFLQAAVGYPLEWDQIVPSFGRREIVKGAIYSYHEFVTNQPMNDETWRSAAATASHPRWVSRYLSDSPLDCSPRDP